MSNTHSYNMGWERGYATGKIEAASRINSDNTLMRIDDGSRPLPFSRDELGRMVRETWVKWAQTQPNPKPSWLVPYEQLTESDKEADRQIGEAIARWTLIGDAARAALAKIGEKE